MADAPPRLYVCFEPDEEGLAQRLDSWPHTNPDHEAYNRRLQTPVDDPAAELIRTSLAESIRAADLALCIIGRTTFLNPWIAWELRAAKNEADHKPLVGVLLHEHAHHPPDMVDSGAVFVPFRREPISRAIEWALAQRAISDDFTLIDD